MQPVERFRHLVRLHQRVGAMEQQHVDIIGFQAPQAALHAFEDVFAGKIVVAGPDAAFGLDQDFFAHVRAHADRLGEHLLAASAAIDVGIVEKVDALLERSTDQCGSAGLVCCVQPETAEGNLRSGQHPADENLFHGEQLLSANKAVFMVANFPHFSKLRRVSNDGKIKGKQ